ncbi:MAG: class I SAM-dependent methyltransferase, partial [Planctomycetota bacterium]
MATAATAKRTFVQSAADVLRRCPPAYSFCRTVLYTIHALRKGFWKEILGLSAARDGRDPQQVITWSTSLPFAGRPVELTGWLRSNGVDFSEGSNAVYLPPQPALESVMPSVVAFYPPGCGFKILKDFRPPEKASYLAKGGSHGAVRGRLIGTPRDQLTTANYMHALGIGPRAWDVCCLEGAGASYTAFVVDHLTGTPTSESQHAGFVKTLRQMTRETLLRVLLPSWEKKPDFAPPDCGRNLLRAESTGSPQYVDFQNFRITRPEDWTRQIMDEAKGDLHFGNGRPWRSRRYLYQSIPGVTRGGKRDTSRRWSFLLERINEVGLNLTGRVVLDVGCNSGMILGSSLSAGASWGLGWDRPNVVPHAEKLLLSLGGSRFSLFGADLHPDYPLKRDVPQNLAPKLAESVVFYLSVRQHVGMLRSLERIPWRALVYEGHQRETVDQLTGVLSP